MGKSYLDVLEAQRNTPTHVGNAFIPVSVKGIERKEYPHRTRKYFYPKCTKRLPQRSARTCEEETKFFFEGRDTLRRTPTRVGKLRFSPPSAFWAYPHPREERSYNGFQVARAEGLPPLTHVGKREEHSHFGYRSWAYPHPCGEYYLFFQNFIGSPPPAWGTLLVSLIFHRITPTRVENTAIFLCFPRLHGGLPQLAWGKVQVV